MSRLPRTGPFRTLVVAMLLCVLAIRVIVPQGYMWSTDADGAPEMVVCSGFMPAPEITPLAATALAAQHESDQREHGGTTADHPCAFAAASSAVDLAAVTHPAVSPEVRADAPAPLRIFARPGRGLAAPPPPKTGPPLLA